MSIDKVLLLISLSGFVLKNKGFQSGFNKILYSNDNFFYSDLKLKLLSIKIYRITQLRSDCNYVVSFANSFHNSMR